MSIESIDNYLQLSASISTSGQPTEQELADIVNADVKLVINLGLHNSEYSLPDEASLLNEKNIQYVHIPVDFHHPKENDLLRFMAVMAQNREKKIFIHCAANKRVSAFMAVYRITRLGWQKDKAFTDLYAIWRPDAIWQTFIDRQLQQQHSS